MICRMDLRPVVDLYHKDLPLAEDLFRMDPRLEAVLSRTGLRLWVDLGCKGPRFVVDSGGRERPPAAVGDCRDRPVFAGETHKGPPGDRGYCVDFQARSACCHKGPGSADVCSHTGPRLAADHRDHPVVSVLGSRGAGFGGQETEHLVVGRSDYLDGSGSDRLGNYGPACTSRGGLGHRGHCTYLCHHTGRQQDGWVHLNSGDCRCTGAGSAISAYGSSGRVGVCPPYGGSS